MLNTFLERIFAMKKTRNMFILVGAADLIAKALKELNFKGAVIVENPISYDSAIKIFNNNKSIICSSEIPGLERFHEAPIHIMVSNKPKPVFQNHIDMRRNNISAQFQDIVARHNLDIGDHKSNSSGLNGAPSISDCEYCKYFDHGETPFPRKTLYESKHFNVLVTIGQFITGYLLIIPKKHVMSMAELSEEERKEFLDVLDDMKYMLNLMYGSNNFLVWENGTGNSGKGKAKNSIVHSHVHIAPSKLTCEKITNISGISLDKICYIDLPKYNLNSYLLIAGKNYDEWFINNNPDVYIPRQFIRQIVAEEYGITGDSWNWRIYPFFDLMYKTETDFLNTARENWDTLPDRIKQCTKKYLPND